MALGLLWTLTPYFAAFPHYFYKLYEKYLFSMKAVSVAISEILFAHHWKVTYASVSRGQVFHKTVCLLSSACCGEKKKKESILCHKMELLKHNLIT